MLSYRFRLYPSKMKESILNHQMELCRWLYNRLLSELNLAREKGINMLSYKAGGAGRRLVEVPSRGTSQSIPRGFDRDYVASLRILRVGLGRPELTPVETPAGRP